jgi:hypothetical protein
MADPEAALEVRRGYGTGGGPSGTSNYSPVLKYPLDLGNSSSYNQNFLLFEIKPGGPQQRHNTNTLGTSHIALHIPPGSLKTQYGGNFSDVEGGRVFEESGLSLAAVGVGAGLGSLIGKNPLFALLGAAGGASLSAIGRTFGGLLKPGETTDVLTESQRALVSAGTLAAGALANTLQPVTAGMGVAINPHSALLYRGPDAFRKHGFTFDFWPKSYTEAEAVANILQKFKTAMLPKMGDVSIFKSIYFKFPHEFSIKFFIGTENNEIRQFKQMQIKRSVLTNLQFDFDSPQGPSFYEPPSPTAHPMPVHTRMTMEFQETDFILDYGDGLTSEEMENSEFAKLKSLQEDSTPGWGGR